MKSQGFSLMELIFVLLIVAVLSTFAVKTYIKVIERATMSDAVNMMATASGAQDRYFLKRNAYTNKWSYLDLNMSNDPHLTKGDSPDNTGDGFAVSFQFDYYRRGFVVAQRVGSEKYTYKMVRPFGQSQIYCIPVYENEFDVNFCMDYAGVDEMSQLPANPMVPIPEKITLD